MKNNFYINAKKGIQMLFIIALRNQMIQTSGTQPQAKINESENHFNIECPKITGLKSDYAIHPFIVEVSAQDIL